MYLFGADAVSSSRLVFCCPTNFSDLMYQSTTVDSFLHNSRIFSCLTMSAIAPPAAQLLELKLVASLTFLFALHALPV